MCSSCHLILRSQKLCSPIPEIEKIISDGAVRYFGNGWHHALELVPAHPAHHGVDELFIKAFFDAFLSAVALVHQQVEKLVHFFISKA